MVPTGLKSPIGQRTGNPTVAKKKQYRLTSLSVSHQVLRKMVAFIETYTVSGILIGSELKNIWIYVFVMSVVETSRVDKRYDRLS